jgi:hypothetical protein
MANPRFRHLGRLQDCRRYRWSRRPPMLWSGAPRPGATRFLASKERRPTAGRAKCGKKGCRARKRRRLQRRGGRDGPDFRRRSGCWLRFQVRGLRKTRAAVTTTTTAIIVTTQSSFCVKGRSDNSFEYIEVTPLLVQLTHFWPKGLAINRYSGCESIIRLAFDTSARYRRGRACHIPQPPSWFRFRFAQLSNLR